jgi:molybdenum cofactor guanylyltransferase
VTVELEPLSGAVLVGGKSSRLGDERALAILDDGTPLIRAAIDALASVCDDVLLVGGDPARFMRFDLPARWTSDAIPGEGPLAGILGALFAAEHDACLVLACDLPYLNPELLAAMAGVPRDYEILAYPRAEGYEPLLAIYTRACIPPIERMLYEGSLRAQDLLRVMRVRLVPERIVAEFDPQGTATTNLNSPQDVARAMEATVPGRRPQNQSEFPPRFPGTPDG